MVRSALELKPGIFITDSFSILAFRLEQARSRSAVEIPRLYRVSARGRVFCKVFARVVIFGSISEYSAEVSLQPNLHKTRPAMLVRRVDGRGEDERAWARRTSEADGQSCCSADYIPANHPIDTIP